MNMAIRVFFLLLTLFSSTYLTLCIYEDQVGHMDWHQQYIGKVKHAVFHTQKAARKRVVVSTEENVVASLDLRRGEIFWRHVLGPKDVIDAIDIALGKYVITLSSGGTILRAWNLPDGQMIWESTLSGSTPSKSILSIPTNLKIGKDNVVFVYGGGCLYAVASIDGEVVWKNELTSEGGDIQQLIYPEGTDIIYAVGLVALAQFDAYQINVKTGGLLKHSSMVFPAGFSGDLSFLTSGIAVALDSTGSVLVAVDFQDGAISFHQTHVSELGSYFSGPAVMLPTKLPGMFALEINKSTVFIKATNDGKLEVLDTFGHSTAVSESLYLSEGQQAFGIIQQGDGKIILTIKLGNDWTSNLLQETIQMDYQRGIAQKVFINTYVRTDRSNGFRALIVNEDHSLLLVQQGDIVWSREDGLASITDVMASELPVEKDGVSVAKVEHNLFEWLKGHFLKLKGTLMIATPDDVAAIQRMRLRSSEKSKMTRDHNGFRKLLIVLTRAGKLFALHTGDGRIVWSLLLDSLRKSETCQNPRGLSLHQWQDPHHHVLDEDPSVLVVGRCDHSTDSPGVLSIVDTYTGQERSHMGPTHSITRVIPLPFTDSVEQRLHLLLDVNQQARLYPRTNEALDIFQRELGNIYWYSADVDEGILKGHAVQNNCILEIADSYCFHTRDLWSIVLPLESEKIIATATRNSIEVVHTQAKVMSDQEVIYKYISKNLLFFATVAPKAVGPIGSVTPEESWLVVYVIDTVTGRILHRMTHHGSQGPVRAVFSENWVVYHYFNLKAHRYEMSVIEIYDQSRLDNKDILKLLLGKHNLTSPITAYSRPEVITKSQSYFFTHSLKTLAVTSTAKGITSKQLLLGTIGDQVLALDKRFLDPRRTINPTQAEKEEGIIPLTDSLPIIPQSYVTHALKVEGLKGIATVPAKLESTTLVFAYGVDLFFTRLAPSRTYDSLTEDFSYALLLITIVALVIAIFVTWIWSERKELQEKWR
ncbi:ER membrane complex subunit 1-like [Olea europaea subsp. europaea]|uniref:ER membrane protein complex subunit 1 n=2 Tax=Olea europaea subsp. europaea TaxID=158383 RepID=A0A8S0UHY8_OLEEU|nr:ER membrane complex subunit 1-like [Olea europaea subsp. europaea]